MPGNRRVFDCLLYNGEMQVLEMRLHELDAVVDRFVVVESDMTFSGRPKRIAFDPTHSAIEPFAHKIDHVLVSDMPKTENPWDREAWQRNAMLRGVGDAADRDMILMSDVDEIPRASVVASARDDEEHAVFFFRLAFYYFFANYRNVKGPEVNKVWNCAATHGEASRLGPQSFRQTFLSGARVFDDAGWHFSYLTDEAGVKRKISSFSHQELNTDAVLSAINIPAFVRRGADLYNRSGYRWALTDGRELPQWVQDNRQRLPELFSGENVPVTDILAIVSEASARIGSPGSDKEYWHGYTETYEKAFNSLGEINDIFEFGVAEGESIRWLARRFPYARIVGADITSQKANWPVSDRINYVQVDQNDRARIKEMFKALDRTYDLMIEDGSHIPQHQAACLNEGMPFVRPGKLYILEDIHTSHPDNADFRSYTRPGNANCLHVLLAIQHLRRIGRALTPDMADELETPGFFTAGELAGLFEQIAELDLYKRTSLPLRCYRCGSQDFDYKLLRCSCGVNLYSCANSMAFLIRKSSS